jgi:hypothetical protein
LPRKESRKAWNFYLEWTFRVKSVVKSRFYAISPDFNDFTRFWPDFTYFRVLQAI